MYCSKCGAPIDDNATFCPNCGSSTSPAAAQPYNYTQPQPAPQTKSNGCAIAGFILAFFMPLIGFILSIVGISKAKECGGDGKGLAIAGLVLSLLDIIVYIIIIAVLLVPAFA